MWFGEKHKEALATLRYGILDNKGFLLLTGDVGTGKTTLINALLQSLTDDVICTSVPDPGLEKLDFFNYIAAAFGIDKEFSTKGTFLSYFRKFLIQANENKKKVLLIIDEAQLLTQEMLEEIRLLSNIEKTDAKLINIFFVGQNEFNEILNREQNRAVRQRLTLNYNIDPLTPDETAEYIKHRLAIAGATYLIFDETATQEVFLYSGGFPRRINVICDHSLLSGYVSEQKIINSAIVRECAKELKIPASVKNRDINGFAAGYLENPIPLVKVQPYKALMEKTETRKKRKWGHFFLIGVMCLMIGFFATLFYILSNEDRYPVTGLGKISMEVKHKVLEILPESYVSFLNLQAVKTEPRSEIRQTITDPVENLENKKTSDRMEKKKSDDVQASTETILNGKNYPIQEEFSKTESFSDEIQPKNEVTAIAPVEEDSLKNSFQSSKAVEENKNKSLSSETVLQKKTDDISGPEVKKEILALPKEKIIVGFKYNANEFTDQGFSELVGFTDVLIMHPEAEILIVGYSDSEGYEKYNQKLSEFRANIVRSFFLGRGIRPDKIEVQGLGSQNPVESNDTAWGRMMNRRVEIEVKKSIIHNTSSKKLGS